jgi:hypothetical protein
MMVRAPWWRRQRVGRDGGGDGSPDQRLDVRGRRGGGAEMSNGGGGASVTAGVGGGVLQCRRRRERVRHMPIKSHDARKTGSSRRRGIDAGSGSDFRW